MKTTVSIVGASGYTGTELIRLLLRHPSVSVQRLYAHASAGKRLAAEYPAFAKTSDLAFLPIEELGGDESEVLFAALPHNESQKILPQLADKKKIIDLGGDFRLKDASAYARYYHAVHIVPEMLSRAVYGMPELNRSQIANAGFVANPGCYATSAILALAPLAQAALLPANIAIVSLSGVSGAGRTLSAATHFAEANESVSAYKIGVHQHTPEIEQTLAGLAGSPVAAAFIPHLLPITRGIHTTIVVPMPNNYTVASVRAMYETFYASAPFVRVLAAPPRVKDVNGTNFCDIYIGGDEHAHALVVLSAEDNLIKGAAGQAIQNMNIMCGFPETEGLV